MMDLIMKQFGDRLKEAYEPVIQNAPASSMTPLEWIVNGMSQFVFTVKAPAHIYKPLMLIRENAPIRIMLYKEKQNLIFRLDISSCWFETEIQEERKIKSFLRTLYNQEFLNIVVLDSESLEVMWLNNLFRFWNVRDEFNAYFQEYGIF